MSPRAIKTADAAASLATPVALPPGRMIVDGKVLVSVRVNDSLPFARACVAVLKQRDGRDRSQWLQWSSFWVPEDVLPLARERVEEGSIKL